MKNFYIYLIILISSIIAGCEQIEEKDIIVSSESMVTKSYGDKYPFISVYIETNDVNPLNAGDYMLDDGTSFFDIVELFASNIHKDPSGNPTLFLNDKLANILENGGVEKYVRPLQEKGIRVLLSVIGNWQHIGLANMNSVQTTQFAEILAYVVNHYGLDGIGLNDEYADYEFTNETSFSEIIIKLHSLMPADKIISVYDWGNTHLINEEAAALIDHCHHGYYGSYVTFCNVVNMTPDRWSASALNLGNYYSVSTVSNYTERIINDGYGGMMFFNLRTRDDRDPLPVFQALSSTAYGMDVYCEDGNRPRDVIIDRDGYTISHDMVK